MSLPYRLGSTSLFVRPNEESLEPKRVVFLSTEGTSTEVCYFRHIERYRNQLKIASNVHIEVLRRYDTKSDPDNVLELLEEYVNFRKNNVFERELSSLKLGNYTLEFIHSFLNDPMSIATKNRNQFEAVLREEHIDLLYLDFLSKYRGTNDIFGIVIDRDRKCHTTEQIKGVVEKCHQKGYHCYMTNPCIEFWLLLHISDVQKEFAEQFDEILENNLDASGNSFVSNLLHAKTGQRKSIQVKIFEQYYLPNVDLAISRSKDFANTNKLIDNLGSNLGDLFDLLRKPEPNAPCKS